MNSIFDCEGIQIKNEFALVTDLLSKGKVTFSPLIINCLTWKPGYIGQKLFLYNGHFIFFISQNHKYRPNN